MIAEISEQRARGGHKKAARHRERPQKCNKNNNRRDAMVFDVSGQRLWWHGADAKKKTRGKKENYLKLLQSVT